MSRTSRVFFNTLLELHQGSSAQAIRNSRFDQDLCRGSLELTLGTSAYAEVPWPAPDSWLNNCRMSGANSFATAL